MIKIIEEITRRIYLLNSLCSASPPIALTAKLSESHPDYYSSLKTLHIITSASENQAKLANIKLWCEKTLTVEEEEYTAKLKALKVAFTVIIESDILTLVGSLDTDASRPVTAETNLPI